jgi:hypothetical protein
MLRLFSKYNFLGSLENNPVVRGKERGKKEST